MHKLCWGITPDDSAKQTRLLHGCNLAFLVLLLCTSLPVDAAAPQQARNTDTASAFAFYEGLEISTLELAGRPDLDVSRFLPLVLQSKGEPFSAAKIQDSVAVLKRTGQFTDVQVALRPEQEGVRVMFILQPAYYFGLFQFPGAEKFPYTRLLPSSGYTPQEPYSTVDLDNAASSLLQFFRRNGYFLAEVHPEVRVDKDNLLANVDFHVMLNRLADFGDVIIQGPTDDEAKDIEDSLHSLWARIKRSAILPGSDYSLDRVQNAKDFIASELRGADRLAGEVQLVGADYNPETNRANIIFHVQPGPPVHIGVEGTHLWPWTKRKLLPVYQQNGLGPELVQEGRQNLLQRLRKKGYFDAQVQTDVNARPNGINVLYKIDKNKQKEIEGVRFMGNRHFTHEELISHVNVKTAGLFSNGSYDAKSVDALEGFYQSKGFNQVEVKTEFDTEGDNVVVVFVIQEGVQDTVESLRVVGNHSISLQKLSPNGLKSAAGQPYAQKSIDEDRNQIIRHYLEQGYLTASVQVSADSSTSRPNAYRVLYQIDEGPRVTAANIVAVGNDSTKERLIRHETQTLQTGQPLTQRKIFTSESRLYTTGVFDWAEVNPRTPITTQEHEAVVIKLHEAGRNTLTYGFGYQFVNQGGALPSGTVALPGLPAIGVPSTFKTSQRSVQGPRVHLEYTRNNIRGKAETATISGLYGPLDRQASFVFTDPNFRWTSWRASLTATALDDKENPTFRNREGQFGFQLQKPITADRTQTLLLRYTFTRSNLSDLLIPELVPPEDRRARLSTLAAVWIRDTRDNQLDPQSGMYDSFELDANPAVLGSNVSFGKILAQAADYRKIGKLVWANSLRLGFAAATSNSHVPQQQLFYTGGGSTLRGFPLNGAGPQEIVTACGDPADPSTCGLVQIPTGGKQLLILNSELRIPLPLTKGLGFAMFYDGGNAFKSISFNSILDNYTNSVGVGLRYATPVGPLRLDVGHNLSPVPGIKATQIFFTVGPAF